MPINFFNPSAPAGIVASMWDVQSSKPSTSRERISILGPDGDETASMLYGERETITLSCQCNAKAGGAITAPSIGEVVNGYHIDSVSLTFNATAAPTMDVSAHKHATGASHNAAHRKYSIPSDILSTLKGGVGVPTGIAGLSLDADLADGFSQVTIALAANHVEAPYVGTPPAIPASDNHDGSITITAEVIGDTIPAAPDGFDKTEESTSNGNTTNDTCSVTFVKHIAHD